MSKTMQGHASRFCFLLVAFTGALIAGEEKITYDYIIVGNGTAGAALARKLSDNKKTKVLVLEAGVNNSSDPNVLQAAGADLLVDLSTVTISPKYAEIYGVQANNPLQFVVYSEGRGWGGSSAHNYMQAVRGSPSVYDGWATTCGNTSWTYNNLLPLMLALETYTPDPPDTLNPAERGTGGPIKITQTSNMASIMMDPLGAQLDTGTGSGFIDDINDATAVSSTGLLGLGVSPFQQFATPGPADGSVVERSFSINGFLPSSIVSSQGKAQDGRLLRIESNASVSRVLFEGTKAVGVEFVYGLTGNKVLTAYGKKIILCAGGINSAAILQRSGIGPAALLNSLGIHVIVDNPNVGANLENQYGVNAIALTTTDQQPFLQAFVSGTAGAGTLTPFLDPFVYDTTKRRLQIGAAYAGNGVSLIFGFILQPSSRGSVQIVSPNPLTQPEITFNLYSDGGVETNGTDANLAVTAYYLIANSVGTGNMLFPPSTLFGSQPGTDPVQDALLLQQAQGASGIVATSHILGTTRLGTSIQNGVVDGNLNVFGVENLMVADLGVAPQSPDGNTCYAAYLIALNAARILGVPVPPAL